MNKVEGGDYAVKLNALAKNTFLRWKKRPSKSVVEEALKALQNGKENALIAALALDMRIADRYSGFFGVLFHPFAYRRETAARRRIGRLIAKFGGTQIAISAQGENAQTSGGGSGGENGENGVAKTQEEKAKQKGDNPPAEETKGELPDKKQEELSESKDEKAEKKEQDAKESKRLARAEKSREKTLKDKSAQRGARGGKTAEKERKVAEKGRKTVDKESAPIKELNADRGAKKPNEKGERGDIAAAKDKSAKTVKTEKPVQGSKAPKADEKTAVIKSPDEIYFGDIPEILGLYEPAEEGEKPFTILPFAEDFNGDNGSIQSHAHPDLAAEKDGGVTGQNESQAALDENAERIRVREAFENMDEKDLTEIKNAMARSLEEQSAKAVDDGEVSRMNISVKEAFEPIIHGEKSSAVNPSDSQPPQINSKN